MNEILRNIKMYFLTCDEVKHEKNEILSEKTRAFSTINPKPSQIEKHGPKSNSYCNDR